MSDALILLQNYGTEELVHHVRNEKKSRGFKEPKDLAQWLYELSLHNWELAEIQEDVLLALILEELQQRGVVRI